MTDDNDNDANDSHFDDTLGEILGTSCMAASSLDLDLALAPSTPTSPTSTRSHSQNAKVTV